MLRKLRARACAIVVLSALTFACGLPRDPDRTSQRLGSTRELRVGVSDSRPWTRSSGGEPQGTEPDLVRRFAASVGARVRWTPGSETQLVQSLKHGELDLVIGGFDKKTQWSSTAGVTQPFAKDSEGKQHVFLAAPGENRFILNLDRFLTAHMRASQVQS
jgi:ABC-type amino acid transport substrate-binding protein